MKKTLDYFVKYDRQDEVRIGWYADVDGSRVTGVINGSDAALLKAGRKKWDEDTICSVHGLVRAPEPKAEGAPAAPRAPKRAAKKTSAKRATK